LSVLFGSLSWVGESSGQGKEHLYLTISTQLPRPLAMGGAFTAINDDLAALLYNPASFSLYRDDRVRRLTLFFNPIAPIVALREPEALFGRSTITSEEALAAFAMLIKGVALSVGSFEFGALLGEQAPNEYLLSSARVFDAHGYIDNHYHVLAAKMRVAERVSLGGSIGLYYSRNVQESRKWGLGASYGVQVTPLRNVLVGVSYITLPDQQRDYREALDRIVDGALNFGISVHSNFGTILAADIRNLNEEKAHAGELIREVHLGMEQIVLSHLALRAGIFRKRHESAEDRHAISLGLGLADVNGFWPAKRRFNHPNWLLNYGMVTEKMVGARRFFHTVSLIWRW
ncbi:MAG: hypothetical protein ONA90_11355, partial [candidate division KSB1 bacterium]|nr:hypothetical protein [candidate division KSB1 bacterium]